MGRKKKINQNSKARNVVNRGQASAKNTLVAQAVRKAGQGRKTNLDQAMHFKKHMNRDCAAYCDLVADPWHPKMGWEKVHNPQYSNGQGKVTQTIRCSGWVEHTIAVTSAVAILFQPNPHSIESNTEAIISGNYAVGGILPTATKLGTPGCPPFDTSNAFNGNAGIIKTITHANFGKFQTDVADTDTPMLWGTPSTKASTPASPAQFSYRCVAAGIIVTPTGENQDLRGIEISTLLPEDNAYGPGSSTLPFNYANAHRQRADGSMSLTWLPTNTDIHFTFPTDATTTTGFANQLLNQRAQIQIKNADAAKTYDLMIEYVAYYEICGQSIMDTGNFSDCMPSMGAQIFNGIKSYQYDSRKEKMDGIERMGRLGQPGKVQVQQDKVPLAKHITAQVIKSIPKVEKMADSGALEKPGESKSFFSSLWDTAKGILPAVVPELLALL